MDKLTIDETIEHCEKTCKLHKKGKIYEEHYYVKKWLGELKEYKELNIVHCKDCKHWGTGVAGETENVKCCEYGKYMVGDNGYCVYGKKKEGAE